jgi:8-oxo-dGTP diphosphatase
MNDVTAAVIFDGERVLITRRSAGEKLAGLWEFPGGKVRDGETPQECLERELLEELGLTVRAGEIVAESEYRYEHGAFRILAMPTRILRGKIRLTVHDRFEWVPLADLLRYRLAPADIPIAEKLPEVLRDL